MVEFKKPFVASYIAELSKEDSFICALLAQSTHGHSTSNIVEIMNSVTREGRKYSPFYINDHFIEWQATKIAERQKIPQSLEKKL